MLRLFNFSAIALASTIMASNGNTALAFFDPFTIAAAATAGGSVLSDQVAGDAERVIDRADRFVGNANISAKERIEQVQNVIEETNAKIKSLLEDSSHLIDGRIERIDQLSDSLKDKINEALDSARRNILDIEKQLISDINRIFDRADAVVHNVRCAVVAGINNTEQVAERIRIMFSNVNFQVIQPGLLGMITGDGISGHLVIDDPNAPRIIDTYIPRIQYEAVRAHLLEKIQLQENNVDEIRGIYTDLQQLAGTFRCLQSGGQTGDYYVRHFLEAEDRYSDWNWIAYGG